MNDFLKYEGSVYSYESSDIHSYNMILVGSMHGLVITRMMLSQITLLDSLLWVI